MSGRITVKDQLQVNKSRLRHMLFGIVVNAISISKFSCITAIKTQHYVLTSCRKHYLGSTEVKFSVVI